MLEVVEDEIEALVCRQQARERVPKLTEEELVCWLLLSTGFLIRPSISIPLRVEILESIINTVLH